MGGSGQDEADITVVSANALLKKKFRETDWIVSEILPEGLGMMVARSKIGKSWLAWTICLAASTGAPILGRFPCNVHDSLYIDLEQTQKWSQHRLRKIMDAVKAERADGMWVANEWPRIQEEEGFLQALDSFLDSRPKTRLVVLDTIAKVWPRQISSGGRNLYYVESDILGELKKFAESRGISLLLLHHESKSADQDSLGRVSGTAAFQSIPDVLWVMSRERDGTEGKLYVTGRAVKERTLDICWDARTKTWYTTGDSQQGDDEWDGYESKMKKHPQAASES